MTEVVATRRFQFKLAAKGNVREIAAQMNDSLSTSLNKNICEGSAFVDPKEPLTVVVEMKCATGSDLYSVDKSTIIRMINESEKGKIEHVTGPLELQV
jgi:hypothetical protein